MIRPLGVFDGCWQLLYDMLQPSYRDEEIVLPIVFSDDVNISFSSEKPCIN